MILNKNIQANLTILDYSNILLGGFDNLITLIELNPNFGSVNVNLNNFVGQEIIYDDQYYVDKTIQIQLPVAVPIATVKSIQGYVGQNVYDLNLMAYSGFDNLLKFLLDNNINSINQQDYSGRGFIFDTTFNNDLSLTNVVSKKGYVFASGTIVTPTTTIFYLLKEDGFYLLKEDGFKIILE